MYAIFACFRHFSQGYCITNTTRKDALEQMKKIGAGISLITELQSSFTIISTVGLLLRVVVGCGPTKIFADLVGNLVGIFVQTHKSTLLISFVSFSCGTAALDL